MKTNFETDDDKEWLDKIIHGALMQTELTTYCEQTLKMPEMKGYILLQFEARKKCFEFLEHADPNEKANQEIIAGLENVSKDKTENKNS